MAAGSGNSPEHLDDLRGEHAMAGHRPAVRFGMRNEISDATIEARADAPLRTHA
ncbi:hypothetical protein [Streptomyces sp. NPDC019224]|uniref:hypothetical protein n=1 Tax=Streptomyces sp. NPDC019224 TaxID=3154484 RepID=UPI0033CB63AC